MKWIRIVLYLTLGIAIFWTALTFWAEYSGEEKTESLSAEQPTMQAIIIYNPDPIYNLDEQVCKSFARGLVTNGFSCDISTTQAVCANIKNYDLYIFCANTYNWAPDWQVVNCIKNNTILKGKNVVAITLGAGSTELAQKKLESAINTAGAQLLASKSYWLLRPNDETRLEESNIVVANDMAFNFGQDISSQLSQFH